MAAGSVITSLAILKVNWDTLKRDYIQNFVPFVVECVRTSADDVVSLPGLQESLRTQFGLSLPLNPLRQILQRSAKQGYLTRAQGVFRRDPARCATLDFAEVQQHVTRIHENVVTSLRDFANREHEANWSVEDAEAALLSFIAEKGLAFLYAEAERSPLVLDPSPMGSSFIVGAFISEARRDVRVLEDVELLIKGNILANALFLPDQGRLQQRFQKTRVYLDTTLIIFAAGYAGRDRQAPCSELLALLHDYGADLYCFQASYEEASGILDACTARIRRGQLRDSYGPTIEHFLEEGYTDSDVELLAGRFPQKIASLGLKVDQKPPYEHQFQIDEKAFEEHLQREIGYRNPKALAHDVDCISAIARLRRGQDSYAVETCRAVFVSTNVDLARATRNFFQSESSPGAAALCITDYALGNILWLKNPTKAPELPQKRLIADAYAAMQPPEALWKQYLAEISRLEERGQVSPEDYYLLRHSTTAKSALMDITYGDVSAFTEGTVAEVLAIAKEHIRAEVQQALDDEKSKLRQAALLVDRLESARLGTLRKVNAISLIIAWWASRSLFAVTIAVLGTATLYTFPWSLPDLRSAWLRYALAAAQGLLFVYTVASVAWGTTLYELASKLEHYLVEALNRSIRRVFIADDTEQV